MRTDEPVDIKAHVDQAIAALESVAGRFKANHEGRVKGARVLSKRYQEQLVIFLEQGTTILAECQSIMDEREQLAVNTRRLGRAPPQTVADASVCEPGTKGRRLSRRKIPSREALIEALREADGNMATVARKFCCHRSLVWHRVNDDPELRELVDELSETFIDEAESKLYAHIREGNVVACIFFLKTKARHRGYSERLEFVPLAQQAIEVELGAPTNTIDQGEDGNAQALHGHTAAVALLEQ